MWRSAPESCSFTRLVSQAAEHGPMSRALSRRRHGPAARRAPRRRRSQRLRGGGARSGRRAGAVGNGARRGGRRAAARAAPRVTLERPRRARVRRLLDERRAAARARGSARRRARSPSGSARPLTAAPRARASSASRSPGPGFLNLFLVRRLAAAARSAACSRPASAFGAGGRASSPSGSSSSSSRPTRPGRCTSVTPATPPTATRSARMLAFHGHSVAREFYVNDAGSQMRKLGESIAALARGEEVPEDGYRGDYVERARRELRRRGRARSRPSSGARRWR